MYDTSVVEAFREEVGQPFVVDVELLEDGSFDVTLHPERKPAGVVLYAEKVTLNGEPVNEDLYGEYAVESVVVMQGEDGTQWHKVKLGEKVDQNLGFQIITSSVERSYHTVECSWMEDDVLHIRHFEDPERAQEFVADSEFNVDYSIIN